MSKIMEETINNTSEFLSCREKQINTLHSLLGEADEPVPHSVFVCGNTATGKTACIQAIVDLSGHPHATVNCVESYTPRVLYETILHQLTGEVSRCENLKLFAQNLGNLREHFGYRPVIIVLDKAERLRSMDQTILATFLRLKELCGLNVCTVLVTNLTYESFYFKMGVREPIKVYFPNYNKEELFKIISMSHQSFVMYVLGHCEVNADTAQILKSQELFVNFLNMFLSVFYRPCRDLVELKHMARINFVKYCEPIVKTEIQHIDLPHLWRHISPILKTSLELLYLRLNSSANLIQSSPGKENYYPESRCCDDVEKTLREELTSTKTFAQSFELPYYAKFLLIAAYLASYNPPKEDKRLFMKYHGKQKKRLQQVRAKAKINEKLNMQLGPKAFTLDRLLAIFYAILEEKIGLTSNLLSQIATLVELKLLSSNKELDLDGSKYKCVVGYDFIAAIAHTVGFNVRKYLYDLI